VRRNARVGGCAFVGSSGDVAGLDRTGVPTTQRARTGATFFPARESSTPARAGRSAVA